MQVGKLKEVLFLFSADQWQCLKIATWEMLARKSQFIAIWPSESKLMWFPFQIVALLVTLTASTMATPISIFDQYAPVKLAVANHEAIEVEHYVSATVHRRHSITHQTTARCVSACFRSRTAGQISMIFYTNIMPPEATPNSCVLVS
jgi:hypothetical protein